MYRIRMSSGSWTPPFEGEANATCAAMAARSLSVPRRDGSCWDGGVNGARRERREEEEVGAVEKPASKQGGDRKPKPGLNTWSIRLCSLKAFNASTHFRAHPRTTHGSRSLSEQSRSVKEAAASGKDVRDRLKSRQEQEAGGLVKGKTRSLRSLQLRPMQRPDYACYERVSRSTSWTARRQKGSSVLLLSC